MLKEIKSEILLEKVIIFHNGLNVILGDNLGSNSIGKSNLLMIIDFIFGGNTYIKHNIDVVNNLGHHKFFFTLEFNHEKYYFCRGTEEPDSVYNCSQDYTIKESIKLQDYGNFLKEKYGVTEGNLTFRSAVNLFSRVWGKNNYTVNRPLHSVSNEKTLDSIIRLIKLLDQYDKIEKEEVELKQLSENKALVTKAGNKQLIPKINKTNYNQNIKEIDRLKNEIDNLSKSIYSPSINITEIVSDEILQLREQKKTLLNQINYYKNRLIRTDQTISNSLKIKFDSLIEFFPDVNKERLEKIEGFHEGITSILSDELKQTKKELLAKISALNEEIKILNQNMDKVLNPNEEPNIFIDNLIEVSSKLKTLQLENSYYEKSVALKSDVDVKKNTLSVTKEEIVKKINNSINNKIKEINESLHNEQRKPPILSLKENEYEYLFSDNTGTGNAFKNLIIFDLAIFDLTVLPFIIHDSFLFKNIEKNVIENIISYYNSTVKQVFIAIDMINIYDDEIQKILINKKVIQLTKDKLLFTADWRDSKN